MVRMMPRVPWAVFIVVSVAAISMRALVKKLKAFPTHCCINVKA